MSGRAKLAIVAALMFVIMAAPALGCVIYIAQSRTAHKCCPQQKSQRPVLTRCCVYPPAITAGTTDIAAPMITASAFVAGEAVKSASDLEPAVVPSLDTSPPGCNSILRI